MTQPAAPFPARTDDTSAETGTSLTPKFDADGLIVAIVVDADRGDVLMVAHMNAEALTRTIETRQGWFWSRSRRKFWRKGEDSGNTLAVTEVRIDCDQDAVLVKARVAGDGVTCHTGYRSCFYRTVPLGAPAAEAHLAFDPAMPRVTK